MARAEIDTPSQPAYIQNGETFQATMAMAMSKGAFGDNLRREREMRGVALQEISNATRISTRFLEALETEQWDRLPGGVFRRGFIRAVARYLGLNEDALLAEYALATNDNPEVAVWADSPAKAPNESGGLRPLLISLLLVVLGVAGWLAWREYSPMLAAWRSPLPNAPHIKPPAAPGPAESSGTVPAGNLPPSVQAAGNGTASQAAADAGTLDLKISVGSSTAVTIIADGKTVFDGRMSANENRRFQAQERFEVSAGNSTAVLLEMNGQAMPPLGTPGQPGRLTLTRSDLRKQAGGQD